MDHDRYDVLAVPDVEGQPSLQQARGMVRKLLADRFKLTFHNEKRDMAAFVLTVGKNGQKLAPTQSTGPLPGMGMGPGAGGIYDACVQCDADGACGFFADDCAR